MDLGDQVARASDFSMEFEGEIGVLHLFGFLDFYVSISFSPVVVSNTIEQFKSMTLDQPKQLRAFSNY